MQLGSRWNAGQPPHPGVPELLHAAIATAEAELADATPASWTLTWLEGRPRVELIDAAGKVRADIGVDAGGRVHQRPTGEALRGSNTPPGADAAGHRVNTDHTHDDTDDDDWLS